MTPSARAWCEKMGSVITEHPDKGPIKNFSEVDNPPWKDLIRPLMWNNRGVWFSKALSLDKTPFENSLWIDLDCEVLQNVAPLFEMSEVKDGFSISYSFDEEKDPLKKMKILKKGVRGVQSGVFAFKKNSPVVSAWIDRCITHHRIEFSEETTLSHLLDEKSFEITYFSNKFNWTTPKIAHIGAVILHHSSATQKRNLLNSIRFD